jgi:hypothetical protein
VRITQRAHGSDFRSFKEPGLLCLLAHSRPGPAWPALPIGSLSQAAHRLLTGPAHQPKTSPNPPEPTQPASEPAEPNASPPRPSRCSHSSGFLLSGSGLLRFPPIWGALGRSLRLPKTRVSSLSLLPFGFSSWFGSLARARRFISPSPANSGGINNTAV